MKLVKTSLRKARAAIASYGPSTIKKALWDREYSAGNWNFNDDTLGDCVYPFLEKYAQKGSILDIGCGSGNTANEVELSAYSSYVGVDISEAALEKARKRSERNGRANKNIFVQADFLDYVPNQQFNVILFRESMYLVPMGEVKATLDRYSKYLKEDGVFVVRICTVEKGKIKQRPTAMVHAMETGFEVLEKVLGKNDHGELGPTVIVFRPRVSTASRRLPIN